MNNELLSYAKFLLNWSKGKQIKKQPNSSFHKCGKWMTKITPQDSQALRDSGLAVGNAESFKMNKTAINA